MGCGASSASASVSILSVVEPVQSQACTFSGAGQVGDGVVVGTQLARQHASPESDGVLAEDQVGLSNGPPLLKCAKDSTLFSERGVSLSFLLYLIESGHLKGGWTSRQALDYFVLPVTKGHKCSLFDLVPPEQCGKPQYFIAHAWSCPMDETLELLRAQFKVRSASDPAASIVFVWIDVVAVSHHKATPTSSPRNRQVIATLPSLPKDSCQPPSAMPTDASSAADDAVASLDKVLSTTMQTVLCLDETCTVLRRMWCLFEVLRSVRLRGAGGLLVVMTWTTPHSTLRQALDSLDISTAGCTLAADKKRMSQELGLSGLSKTELGALNEQIRTALISSATAEVQLRPLERYGADALDTSIKSARLLSAHGQVDIALPLLEKVNEMRLSLGTFTSSSSCISISELAICYSEVGRRDEALPLYRSAVEGNTDIFGPSHPVTLSSMDDLASCLYHMGQYEEALPLFQSLLRERQAVRARLYAKPESLLNCLNNLAACLRRLHRFEEALPLFEKSLEGRDESHPETVTTMQSIAQCLGRMGRDAEALPWYRKGLERSIAVLGTLHPDTTAAISSMAGCLASLGKHTEALPLYRKALEATQAELGSTHADYYGYVNNVAECLRAMGQSSDALPLFKEALEGTEPLLGPSHPHTTTAVTNLASCLFSLQQYKHAMPLFKRALEAREAELGPTHLDTVECVMSLGAVLKAMGDVEAARPLLARAHTGFEAALGPTDNNTMLAAEWLAACQL